jgi:hypothetical protein
VTTHERSKSTADLYQALLEREARLESLIEQLLERDRHRDPLTGSVRPSPTANEGGRSASPPARIRSCACWSSATPIGRSARCFSSAPVLFATTSDGSSGSWERPRARRPPCGPSSSASATRRARPREGSQLARKAQKPICVFRADTRNASLSSRMPGAPSSASLRRRETATSGAPQAAAAGSARSPCRRSPGPRTRTGPTCRAGSGSPDL